MTHHVMTDQPGVRFGVGNGVLFLLTGAIVTGGVPGAYGVALLLVTTSALALALDPAHAAALGVAGWAFATGFAVHTLGELTFAPPDLLRLGTFVLAAALACRLGPGT